MITWNILGAQPVRRRWASSQSNSGSTGQTGKVGTSTTTTSASFNYSTATTYDDLFGAGTGPFPQVTTQTETYSIDVTTGTTAVSTTETTVPGGTSSNTYESISMTGSEWWEGIPVTVTETYTYATTSSTALSRTEYTTTEVSGRSFITTATTTASAYATTGTTTESRTRIGTTISASISSVPETIGHGFHADTGNILIVFGPGTHHYTEGVTTESTTAAVRTLASTAYITSSVPSANNFGTPSTTSISGPFASVSESTIDGTLPVSSNPPGSVFPTPTTSRTTELVNTTIDTSVAMDTTTGANIDGWTYTTTAFSTRTEFAFDGSATATVIGFGTVTISSTKAFAGTTTVSTSTGSSYGSGTSGESYYSTAHGETWHGPLSITEVITAPGLVAVNPPAYGSWHGASEDEYGYYPNSAPFEAAGLAGALSGPCPAISLAGLESSVQPQQLGLLPPGAVTASSGGRTSTISFGADGKATSSWTTTTSISVGTDTTTASTIASGSFAVEQIGDGVQYTTYFGETPALVGPVNVYKNDGDLLVQDSSSQTLHTFTGPGAIGGSFTTPVKIIPIQTIQGPCVFEVQKYITSQIW